jgi:hypothetical protein
MFGRQIVLWLMVPVQPEHHGKRDEAAHRIMDW